MYQITIPMKTYYFYIISLLFLLFSVHSFGQKTNHKPEEINPEKVAYVAQNKTDALDKIVSLDEKTQKKQVYQIYETYVIKEQKKRKVKNFRKRPSKANQNSAKIRSSQKIHHEKNITAVEDKNHLHETKELDKKIKNILSKKQRRLLSKHEEKDKEFLRQ